MLEAKSSLKFGMNLKVSDFIGVFAVLILLATFTIINPQFLDPVNIKNLMEDISLLLILAIPMTFILILGSIDLSVCAVASCSTIIFVMLLPKLGVASFFIAMLFGLLAGLFSGVLHAVLKVPSFIATFGAMGIFSSFAMLIGNGASQQISRKLYPFIQWYKIKLGVVPMSFIVAAILLLIMLMVQNKTSFGKSLYAVGGNESAARTTGINVVRTKLIVFALGGLFTAIGGIVLACKLKGGNPTVGDPFTMMTIASVALGGTSMSGGKGGLFKTIIGVVIIVFIQNGMNMIGIQPFTQKVAFGVIILVAVFMTTDRNRRQLIVK